MDKGEEESWIKRGKNERRANRVKIFNSENKSQDEVRGGKDGENNQYLRRKGMDRETIIWDRRKSGRRENGWRMKNRRKSGRCQMM